MYTITLNYFKKRNHASAIKTSLKTFQVSAPFKYHLKTWENLWFSHVFRGYRNGTLSRNGFTILSV